MRKFEMYGAIGIDVTAREFVAWLEGCGDDDVRIHLNSEGGFVEEAMAIYNRIVAREGKTECIVDGLAASAASIVLMACSPRICPHNSMVMIHNAWTPRGGNASELRSAADMLEKTSTAMAQIYAERTGLPMEQVVSLLDEEAWMSAEDCLQMGFCDFVTGPSKQVEANAAYAMAKLRKHIDVAPKRVAFNNERASAKHEEVEMSEEMDALKARLAELEEENQTLKSALEANREEVDEQANTAEALASRVVELEDEITFRELAEAGVPEEHRPALAQLKRTNEDLFKVTVSLATTGARVQEPIGKTGSTEVNGSASVEDILAQADEAGVKYGKGLATWLAKNHPERATEVLAAVR